MLSSKFCSALKVSVLILATLVLTPPLTAQYNTASLGGSVVDPSGAAVPDAKVSVRNLDTRLEKTTATAGDGTFLVPSLPPGRYRLTVEKAGFATSVLQEFTLVVNQAATQNVVLKVGQVASEVTVSSSPELVATREATLGQVVDERRLVDLPLNGRQAQSLVFLAGGTVDTTANHESGEGGTYPGEQLANVSGAGPVLVNYQLDGAGHNDPYMGANLPFPNPDAVAEFNLQSQNLSAEYGDASSVVNIVSKSGTNDLHGDLFEFLRNGVLNARNFFAADQDTLKRNQFGGSAGGPIRKDKIFFFATYQGTRIRTAPGGQIAFVPTAAERSGDFSDLCPLGFNASGICPPINGTQLIDPVTGVPLLNNQIPVSPVSNFFLQHIPLPNGPGRRLTFVGGAAVPDEDQFLARIDQNRNKHQISGKYFQTYFRQSPIISKSNLLLDTSAGNHVRVQTVSLNDSYAASPTVLLNTWFGWHAQTGGSLSSAPFGFPDAGVKIAAPNPPELDVIVGGAFTVQTNHKGDFDRTGFDIREGVTLVRGKHELHVGGEAAQLKATLRNTWKQAGRFRFTRDLTGDNVADFVVGRGRFQQGGGEFLLMRGVKWSAFVQDNWRASPKLTLNLGLRWDPFFPYTEEKGRIVCFVPGAQSTRFPNAPVGMIFGGDNHDRGCPKNGSESTPGNFSPRLGFAYRLTEDGKTSVRGGAGLYYAIPVVSSFSNTPDNAPFSPQFGFEAVDFTDPYGSASVTNPFPSAYAPHIPGSNVNFVLPTSIIFASQPDWKPPQIATWNLMIERQIGRDWLVRGAYSGNKGTHLYGGDVWGYPELNPAVYIPGGSTEENTQQRRILPSFGSVAGFRSHYNSNYNALQLTAEKRLLHGISILANYTWAKTLDDFGFTDPFNRRFDHGVSSDSIRHNFNLSEVWQLPLLKLAGVTGKILNGWELNSIWSWRSGFPFSVFSGLDNSFSGVGLDRADFIKSGNPQLGTGRSHGAMVQEFFDTSLFNPLGNAVGTFGNSGKDIVAGPRFFDVDVGLLKTTRITERGSLQFRAEFFNVFNNVNFGQPDNTVTDATFGQILSAGDPRIIQFALKLMF